MGDFRGTRHRLLKEALAPEGRCASLRALSALRAASLPQHEESSLRRHLAGCPRCQTELRLLTDFEEAKPRPEEQDAVRAIVDRLARPESPAPPSPSAAAPPAAPVARGLRWSVRRLRLGGFAVAAGLLLAAVGIALREGATPELTSPRTPEVLRSGDLGVLSPAGDLAQAPTELRWQPWPRAASYSVRVMEVDRTELWAAETAQTEIALPREVQARIVPRKPLIWEVVARDAAGGTLASSGTHRFQLRTQR